MRQPFEISFENDTPAITLPIETSAVNATKIAHARAVELPGVLVTLSRGGRKIASWAQPPDADAGQRARQERTRQAEVRLAASPSFRRPRCPICGGLNPGDITHARCD